MNIFTILLFFIYNWGLGYTATKFLKNSDNFLERNIVRIGIGLGIIPILGVVINFLRIPIDWRIFLIISLIYPLIDIFRHRKLLSFKFRLTKSDIYVLVVLILFLASLFMYVSGAFKYPWLEDDDPWLHAESIKYISKEKGVFNSPHMMYINPYPPGYGIILGILHQTSPSLYWTMKFFNALIISLGILFFYFFVKEFLNNRKKALFSTFVLAMIPSYLSHFIWAISLTMSLFFVAFYCLEMIKKDKRWSYITMPIIASILLSQPTHMIYFILFYGIYLVAKMIIERKILFYEIIAGIGGALLSLFWWGSAIAKHTFSGVLKGLGIGEENLFAVSGTADRAYNLGDFFIAKSQNMINNPIGIGIVLSLLFLFSLIIILLKYKLIKTDSWRLVTLGWFFLTIYAVNAATLPVKLSPFRVWMLLAIPISIISSEGAFFLMGKQKSIGYIVVFLLVVGVVFTSGYQKYGVNTAMWGFGQGWTSYDEVMGYVWMKDNLPVDAKVFTFTGNIFVLGFDMYSCTWCNEVKEFQKIAFNESAIDLNKWLKRNGYEYLVVGGRDSREIGINETNAKINEIANSGLFKVVHSTTGALVFNII